MPEITLSDLAAYATMADHELVVVNDEVTARKGSLGGRVARNVKLALGDEDRTAKKTSYREAADAVRAALHGAYGAELGEKAFRSAKGRAGGEDNWVQSDDHPITGRHIRKMIDTAEAELRRTEAFETRSFRLTDVEDRGVMQLAVTQDWIRRTAGPNPESPTYEDWQADRDRLTTLAREGYGADDSFTRTRVIYSDLEIDDEEKFSGTLHHGLESASVIADSIIDDAQPQGHPLLVGAYGNEQEGDNRFWTLTVKLQDGRTSYIAFRIDSDDGDTVHVFDPNRREAAVPKELLAGWLGQHMNEVYGKDVVSTTLQRSDPKTVHGSFVEYRGQPIDATIEPEVDDRGRELATDLGVSLPEFAPGRENGWASLAPGFEDSLADRKVAVGTHDGQQQALSRGWSAVTLESLVLDLPYDDRPQVIMRLSVLLLPDAFTSLEPIFDGTIRDQSLKALAPRGAPGATTSAEIRRDGDDILITHRSRTMLQDLQNEDDRVVSLKDDRDRCEDAITVRVSLAELGKPPDEPIKLEISARRELHIE